MVIDYEIIWRMSKSHNGIPKERKVNALFIIADKARAKGNA